ncbi:MAG: protein kinase [Verrucomicrobiaceae bacterium]|nr:protein kinase [Verrucomicrobiaceae bacterium]
MPDHVSSSASQCAQCGAAIPAGAPFGQCPKCLLGFAFGAMSDAPLVRSFGDYELIEEVARGGMGVVYRARQISLDREVAVKMILAGELAGKKAQQMFQTEAQAAANLHHPNIVPVYEIGEHEMQPFFSMRLVPGGKTIAQWAKQHHGAHDAIAAAVAQVARAVAHAHERGVLHRDLKPSNILWDAEAGPQVTDFGLAKLLDSQEGGATASALMLGSPSYMAPEQAGGRLDEITTATDVYGIGAVLYELLSDKPPFVGKSVMEIARQVAEDATQPLTEVPRDLSTVCMKCLEKNPADRYGSAVALAEDLERFARGEPVLAVPHSLPERVWRWAKRRPRSAALLTLCALSLIGGVAGVLWQWRKAEHARAEQAVALAHLQWQEVDQWLEDGESERALSYLAKLLRERPERWQAAMYAMSIVEQKAFPLMAGPEIHPASKLVVPARLAPDGSWFAMAGEDQVVRVYDATSSKETLQIPVTAKVTALAVASGQWKLAVATADGVLALHGELAASSVKLSRAQPAPILELRFSADGTRLLARGKEHVEVWNATAPSSSPFAIPFPGGIKGSAITADGSRVLTWNAERAVVWDTAAQKELLAVQKREEIRGAVIAAGGKRIACLDGKFHARLWDVEPGAALPDVESEQAARYYLALNDTGTRLTFAGWGNDITVHDTASAAKVSPVMRHNYHVGSVTPSPDGKRMFTYGWDEMLHVWDAATGVSLQTPVRLGGSRSEASVSPSQDGRRVLIHRPAVGSAPELITLWDRSTRQPVLRHRVEGFRNFNSGAMSLDSTLGWMGTDGYGPTRVHVYEIATGKVLLDAPTLGEVYGTHFSPDKTRCYVVTNRGTVHGFSLTDGHPLWPPIQQSGGIIPSALSPDGTRLVAGHKDGHVRIYDTTTGKVLREPSGLSEVRVLRFAPDGSGRFVSGGVNGLLHLWNVHTGEKLQTFTGHTGTVLAAAWRHDSLSFASASGDSTVRVWNVATGQPSAPVMPHLAVPTHLEFSPDGTRLATCSRDGTARLWNPSTGQPLSPPLHQGQACTTVHFTADGAAFFVHDHDGFRFWDTATALPVTLHYQEPVAGGFAFDCEIYHHFMSRDGTRVFLSYARNDGVACTIPQPRGRVPEWFPDFLETLCQLRLDELGAMQLSGRVQAATLIQQLRATKADDYSAWALRVLGER